MGEETAGVLVVGSLTVDLTAACDRAPLPGETVLGTSFVQVAGGKGLNQALAARSLGARTWMVGRTGDDDLRPIVLGALARAGVNTDFVTAAAGGRTGIAHIRVDAGGENSIVMVPLANSALAAEDIDTAIRQVDGRARVLLAQLETPVEIVRHALSAARAAGLITVLDPAPAPPGGLSAELCALTDVITPNETEASILTGVEVSDADSATAAGRILVDRGCGTALVTLGAAGVVVVDRERAHRLPAHVVESVDSTAAGDAFTGALGSRLAAGDPISEAVTWATAAGALATTVVGASSSIPSLAAVEALLGA